MRPALRHAGRVLRPVARASRAASPESRLTVLGWHRVDEAGGGLSTATDVFSGQLAALERWGATVLPLAEAMTRRAAGRLPDRAVVLTFDDGYASVLETAWPLLQRRGLPATLFVVSDYLDGTRRFPWDAAEQRAEHTRLATADQVVAAAADGLDIGSHTVSHRWLPHLDADEVKRELVDSRTALEALVERAITAAAYPMGGWNPAVRDAAAAAGYTAGITVDRGRNGARQHPLELRRAFAPDSVIDFELLLDGAFTWLRPLDALRTRNGVRW